MPDIIQFVPRDQCDAADNLNAFIDLCRNELTIFGADLNWDADVWDVTPWIFRSGRKGRTAMTWSNHDTSKQKIGELLSQPFLSFAKSYIRYQHGMRPTKIVGFRLSALRALERSLMELHGDSKVEKVDIETFNRSAQLVRDKFESSTSYRIGSQLEMISHFLVENKLVADSFIWKNPLKRSRDNNRVGKKADNARLNKLPSEAGLESLPHVYNLAIDAPDIIATSIVAVLCGASDRINEAFRLPVDCEVHGKRSSGEEAYGLRWWPSKGADPMVKWIIGTMADVVKDAISKLRKETEEARRMARWYEEHPGRVYLPEDCSHFRREKFLTGKDISKVIGLAQPDKGNRWAENNGLEKVKIGRRVYFHFHQFEKAVINMLPDSFPFLNTETDLKYSQALLVVPLNTFHPRKSTHRCMFEIVTTDTINNQLGAGQKHGKTSLFSRLGFTEPDGTPIVITSHQFRHWLNTLAQRGGLSQLDIAKWSGRKDIRQNEVYDHVTAHELIEKVRNLDDGSMFGPLAEFVANAPIPREEFMQLSVPTIHSTELGFCIHDWTMMPCQRHADCINCTEQICIKGNKAKTARIKQNLQDAEEQLERAKKAIEEGSAGADRWLIHHQLTVKRLQSLWSILSDPNVPQGAVIQLSNDKEFSPIRVAMEGKIEIGDADSQMLSRIRALSGNKAKALQKIKTKQ
jgi:hypothetical protein